MNKNFLFKLAAIGIFLLAAFFRLYGVNWDQSQHLHPDERFLTMVSGGISWPKNISEYFSTDTSPLNPHNKNFGFFVYGTFPIFLTKWIAGGLGMGDYMNLTLVGRQLSALFDLGTVILVFLTARQIGSKVPKLKKSSNENLVNSVFPLLSMFLYTVMVLPIQLSHFYAVDTYLTFFTVLTFYFLIKIIGCGQKTVSVPLIVLSLLTGISFGLSLASKISAVLFLPVIMLGFLLVLLKNRNLLQFLLLGLVFAVSTYLSFRIAQPYAFASPDIFSLIPNPKVIANWKQLKSFDDPSGGFPPGVQWITTKPYLFPLKNNLLWGLGLPLGLISLSAFAFLTFWYLKKSLEKKLYLPGRLLKLVQTDSPDFILHTEIILSLIFIFGLSAYQGFQFVKALRYFFPVYPFVALIAAWFTTDLSVRLAEKYKMNKLRIILHWSIIILLLLIYPLSFISIYSRPHSRVAASAWIYQNIPPESSLGIEEWDDGLPLYIPNYSGHYKSVSLTLYWPDNLTKWQTLVQKLNAVDYILETSNRLYGSIMTVPGKYPVTNRYYTDLFNGTLGFEKVAEFTSRPNLPIPLIHVCLTPPFARYGFIAQKSQECPLPGISFVDDYADETFTVYDHPKVIIFKKVKAVDYATVLDIAHSTVN